MASGNIVALVLAGGERARLRPLTTDHAKPALAFASNLRLIDFALSNLINSKISKVHVIAQYKPWSLITHINTTWAPRSRRGGASVELVLPKMNGSTGHFRGTADAVYRNFDLIRRHSPDLVAVFAADHIYRMDIQQMADFHRERNADVTVAAVRVSIEVASSFGVLVTGPDGAIHEFQGKPERPPSIPEDSGHAYASMGNYVFDPRVLESLLREASQRNETDFGHHLLPRMPGRQRIFAYDFMTNRVPGVQPYEEHGYWRDVGTLDALAAAQRDTLGPVHVLIFGIASGPFARDATCGGRRVASQAGERRTETIFVTRFHAARHEEVPPTRARGLRSTSRIASLIFQLNLKKQMECA